MIKKIRPNRENEIKYTVSLKVIQDRKIIEEISKFKAKSTFIKFAIYRKIQDSENKDNSTGNTEINSNTEPTKTFFITLRKTVNQDLVEALEKAKKESKASYFIREALYELIEKGYKEDEIREYEKLCNEKNKDTLIMRPQLSLYKNNEKDMKVAEIITIFNGKKNRDDFIKDAIIEKYSRDNKKTTF